MVKLKSTTKGVNKFEFELSFILNFFIKYYYKFLLRLVACFNFKIK